MVFVAISSFLSTEWISGTESLLFWIYPLRAVLVTGALVACWPQYSELKGKPFANVWEIAYSIGVGILVYLAWVRMDWPWAMQGEVSAGYNPFEAGPRTGILLAGIRLISISIVVPIMEEIFWRSFLIRYIIAPDFIAVPLGKFTLKSFLVSVALFGSEHNLWLAGLMAGAVYNLLLYRTKRLWPCIVAHGTTNFILGIHVLMTKGWVWW